VGLLSLISFRAGCVVREDTALVGGEITGGNRYHQGDTKLQTPVLPSQSAVTLIACLGYTHVNSHYVSMKCDDTLKNI